MMEIMKGKQGQIGVRKIKCKRHDASSVPRTVKKILANVEVILSRL
jgi:hypothetical protein